MLHTRHIQGHLSTSLSRNFLFFYFLFFGLIWFQSPPWVTRGVCRLPLTGWRLQGSINPNRITSKKKWSRSIPSLVMGMQAIMSSSAPFPQGEEEGRKKTLMDWISIKEWDPLVHPISPTQSEGRNSDPLLPHFLILVLLVDTFTLNQAS